MPQILPAAIAQAWPIPPDAPMIRMREVGPMGEEKVMLERIKWNGMGARAVNVFYDLFCSC
jgi:hypothetical protein